MENIRNFDMKDLESIMDIWLNSNIDAHSFIDENYWRSNYDMVKELMPKADLYVYEVEEDIVGFIGIQDNYIAGIFIDQSFRGKNIGKKLLDFGKERYEILSLDVYKENTRALNFYLREDFEVASESLDEVNNKTELSMVWKR